MSDTLADALKALLAQITNIEVLGEWSALDMNISASKKLRSQIDAVVATARSVLAAHQEADASKR